jgi:hypothetical protein
MTTLTPESSSEHAKHMAGQRRRRDSDLHDQRPPPPPRIRELLVYYGRDIQEAQDFISGAERRFQLDRGYSREVASTHQSYETTVL